jgi:biopolymer transport protein ExbD
MAMTTGPGAQINVTPMIDVLLVLIIIFMVILPYKSEGLKTQVPQPSESNAAPPPTVQQDIVLTVEGQGRVMVNQDPIAMDRLDERLKTIFNLTAQPVIFVRGKGSLDFEDIAKVIDVAKGAGFTRIALMNQ